MGIRQRQKVVNISVKYLIDRIMRIMESKVLNSAPALSSTRDHFVLAGTVLPSLP